LSLKTEGEIGQAHAGHEGSKKGTLARDPRDQVGRLNPAIGAIRAGSDIRRPTDEIT